MFVGIDKCETIRNINRYKAGVEIAFFISLTILGLFQVYRCKYPGLYLDSVNPDYLAVQILFPQINNPSMLMPQTGFPLLGQLYHGTVTVWLQLLLVGLSGQTSVSTLRLANMIYVFGICFFMYTILKKIKAGSLSVMMLLLLVMSPQIFSFIRTQYYIKLPGTFFLFFSMYLTIDIQRKKEYAWKLILSGLLCGLAFYSYFIYLFFVPAMLALCIVCSGHDREKRLKNGLFWLSGFCNGALLYGLGYLNLVITEKVKWSKNAANVAGFIIVILGWAFLAMIARYYHKNKNLIFIFKIVVLVMAVAVVFAAVNLGSILAILLPKLNSLHIAGEPMNLVQRVKHVLFLWKGVMNNQFSEWLMLGFTSSIVPNIYIISLLLGTIGVFVIRFVYKKKDMLYKVIVFLLSMQVSYSVFCVVFITRMGGQHFTPMFFLGFFTLLIECSYLVSNVKCFGYKAWNIILVLCIFFANIVNTSLLDTNLEMTGGCNMFTSQIDEMAYVALENKKNGIKEVYVFPEWGFLCGFNYLTMNQVHIMTSVDTNELSKYIENSYRFKICSWQKEKADQYLADLENAGIGNLKVQGKVTKSGAESFYVIEQKMQQP